MKDLHEVVAEGSYATRREAAVGYADGAIHDWEEIEKISHWIQLGRSDKAQALVDRLSPIRGASGATQAFFLKLQGLGFLNEFTDDTLKIPQGKQLREIEKIAQEKQGAFRSENEVDLILLEDIKEILTLLGDNDLAPANKIIEQVREAYAQGYGRAGNLLTRLVGLGLLPEMLTGTLQSIDATTLEEMNAKLAEHLKKIPR